MKSVPIQYIQYSFQFGTMRGRCLCWFASLILLCTLYWLHTKPGVKQLQQGGMNDSFLMQANGQGQLKSKGCLTAELLKAGNFYAREIIHSSELCSCSLEFIQTSAAQCSSIQRIAPLESTICIRKKDAKWNTSRQFID